MLYRANSNQVGDTKLLGKLGSCNQSVVLATCHRGVIVGEVDYLVSAFDSDFHASQVAHLLLLQLNTRCGHLTLEHVSRLLIWAEVKHAHSVVLSTSSQTTDDTLCQVIGTVDDNKLHFVLYLYKQVRIVCLPFLS